MKRDFAELEKRRLNAAKLLNEGLSQAEVARQVNVSRESVRRWKNQMSTAGVGNPEQREGGSGGNAKTIPI